MLSRSGIALLFASVASAIPTRPILAQPLCTADVQKYCSDVPPGGGRIQRCLHEHEAEISKECRSRLDDLVREAGLLGATCRWDIARLCSDVAPGGARIVACLENHAEDLSVECKSQLAKPAR